eukprot:UN26183
MTREEAEQYLADLNGGNDACNSAGTDCAWILGIRHGYTSTVSHSGDKIWMTNYGYYPPSPEARRWFSCVKRNGHTAPHPRLFNQAPHPQLPCAQIKRGMSVLEECAQTLKTDVQLSQCLVQRRLGIQLIMTHVPRCAD